MELSNEKEPEIRLLHSHFGGHKYRGGGGGGHSWIDNLTLTASVMSRFLGETSTTTARSSDHQSAETTATTTQRRVMELPSAATTEHVQQQHPSSGMDPSLAAIAEEEDENGPEQGRTRDNYNAFYPNTFFSSSKMQQPPIPLAYRFYRRTMYRQRSSWPVPFVLLGPNVDHWKDCARQIAAAGFSAIACERVRDEDYEEDGDNNGPNNDGGEEHQGQEGYGYFSNIRFSNHNIIAEEAAANNINDLGSGEMSAKAILDLLDALRWNRAVLVACDSECVMAIQAAQRLAPDRIVGLVLCGQLGSAEAFVQQAMTQSDNGHTRRRFGTNGPFAVDRFLRQYLPSCPSLIVWDGDGDVFSHSHSRDFSQQYETDLDPFNILNDDDLAEERKVIHGSGSAPHRKLPEQMAWVLTRFVEEKVAPPRPLEPLTVVGKASPHTPEHSNNISSTTTATTVSALLLDNIPNFFRHVADFFSQEGMVVFGRIVASILIYGTVLKVVVFQYRTIWNGIFDFQTKLQLVITAPFKFLSMIGNSLFASSSSIKSLSLSQKNGNKENSTETIIKSKDGNVVKEKNERTTADLTDEGETGDADENQSSENDDDEEEDTDDSEILPEPNRNQTNDLKDEGNEDSSPPDTYIRPFFYLDYVVA